MFDGSLNGIPWTHFFQTSLLLTMVWPDMTGEPWSKSMAHPMPSESDLPDTPWHLFTSKG